MPVCRKCGATNPPGARFCNACGADLGAAQRERREMSGERRVVTMLFCDVRGSTSMAEDLDPEEWTDVMNAAYEHLIAPVVRYEGTVARLMGDAILAFFGAPTAHEDDPQRAVMAGLEIVSGIGPFRERLGRERGLDLNVRVGINTGPVVVGDVGSELRQEYSAMGDAVNVAARMEQTAEPGTVQITEDTYRLVSDLFDVEPLGAVELKGKRRPVSSYRVLGRRAVGWKTRAATPLEAPLVGREAEMAVVRGALDDVLGGRGSIVLIVGEPGIGKSRLVEEANALWTERYPDDDRRWDFWHCVPYDTMQPYAQYRRLIRERAGIVESDPVEVVRSKLAGLMRLAPEGWAERSERVARALLGVELEGEPRLEGEAFLREATEVMGGSTIAQGGRRLIVFEDMHWCDHASLELVRAPLRLVADEPIVVLVTFRPDRSAVSWGFREWIKAELGERATLIELEPLSNEHSNELIDELLPVDGMPETVRETILGRTEGNPLFVQEVARDLIDRGLVERIDEGWRLAGDASEVAIPDTVQSLITVGLDRLPDGARRVLQTAAVIGRTFDEDVLLSVAEGNGNLRDHLGELERRDLIRSTGRVPGREYTFRHALTQEAAYGSLLVKRRRAVHRRVAEALQAANGERLEEVAPLLARHFAEAGEDAATLRFAKIAGDAAARLYANDEAERHYRIAIDVARRTGAAPSLLTTLYGRRGGTLELAGRYDDAIATYEEMRELAEATGDEAMELAANGSFAMLYSTVTPKFDPELGRRLSEENVATARRLGDREAEARSLWNILVSSVYGSGAPDRAVEAGEASLAIARELGHREQIAFTLNDLCRAYLAKNDFRTAALRLEEARTMWEELGNRPMLSENLSLSSAIHMLEGSLDVALGESRTALSIADSIGNDWGRSRSRIGIYRVLVDRGDLGSAMREMERSIEEGERGGFVYAGVGPRSELAMALAYLGDLDRALGLADHALAVAREHIQPAIEIAQVGRAHVLLALGEEEQARAALETEAGFAVEPERTIVTATAVIAGSRLALAAGDPDAAARLAEASADDLRSRGIQIFVAEALAELAKAHVASGRLEDAGRVVGRARDQAERLGERRVLWEILAASAELRDRAGKAEEASELRRAAREIVEHIAAGIADEELRNRFLGRDDVRALSERS
jgi:class 3 adenylate cyclase/tetratricopeptide (TPR) repeat protein